jgi:hypothetical protein
MKLCITYKRLGTAGIIAGITADVTAGIALQRHYVYNC